MAAREKRLRGDDLLNAVMTGIDPAYSAWESVGQGRRPGKPDNG
jgi:hypothetical protein